MKEKEYKIIGGMLALIGFGLLIMNLGLATAGIIALILFGNNMERYKQ